MINSLLNATRQRYRCFRCGIRNESGATIGAGVTISNPDDVTIARNTHIGNGVRILGQVSIGENTKIRPHVLLDGRHGSISIGSNSSINDNCVIYGMGGLVIGNDVRIAAHTVIVSGNHNFDDPDTPIRLQGVTFAPISVGDDTWIAANVTILAGVEIGNGCVVGAGAVVTKSLPAYSIAVGNPARIIRKRGQYAE
jgi:acetyltransferase-like isoleucine patch superfamily enzyme